MSLSSKSLRQQIAEKAGHRCGYCLTLETVSGIPLTLEHIVPKSKGGSDSEENLWVSCRLCNEAKGTLTRSPDPHTNQPAPLFNPRTQVWLEHFIWSKNGTQIIGQTPTGRATVDALDLNSAFRVRTRAIWVEAGWPPPDD